LFYLIEYNKKREEKTKPKRKYERKFFECDSKKQKTRKEKPKEKRRSSIRRKNMNEKNNTCAENKKKQKLVHKKRSQSNFEI
jgi:hypothetical protein